MEILEKNRAMERDRERKEGGGVDVKRLHKARDIGTKGQREEVEWA